MHKSSCIASLFSSFSISSKAASKHSSHFAINFSFKSTISSINLLISSASDTSDHSAQLSKMKAQTFTSAMTMMVTIITSFFDRASAAPAPAPVPVPAPAPAPAAAPAPIIANLPPIADINIEAREASADASAEAASVLGDAGDWIIRARRAE